MSVQVVSDSDSQSETGFNPRSLEDKDCTAKYGQWHLSRTNDPTETLGRPLCLKLYFRNTTSTSFFFLFGLYQSLVPPSQCIEESQSLRNTEKVQMPLPLRRSLSQYV